jgi:hypothetical protein
MSSMPQLCIDPHLLSLPRVDRCTPEDVEDYVSSIVDWGKTVSTGLSRAFVSSTVLEAIDEDEAFPWESNLLRVLRHYKIKSADPKTISRVIQSFLQCARIEDTIGIRALLLDDAKTSVTPAFARQRLRPRTKDAYPNLLTMIVLLGHGYGKDGEQAALASVLEDKDEAELRYLSFVTEIVDIEWGAGSDERKLDLPCGIREQVSVFYSRNGLLEGVEPLSLWPTTIDNDAACNAIDCCIARLVASGTSGGKRLSYSLGAGFLESAQLWDCGHDGNHAFTLIESCARIALRIPKQKVKPFFDGITGRQKQRADGALACRTHITKRGAGLRLMFWEMPDGAIEFANVGGKDELAIL